METTKERNTNQQNKEENIIISSLYNFFLSY